MSSVKQMFRFYRKDTPPQRSGLTLRTQPMDPTIGMAAAQ
jgi:hypothetical protein